MRMDQLDLQHSSPSGLFFFRCIRKQEHSTAIQLPNSTQLNYQVCIAGKIRYEEEAVTTSNSSGL